MHLKEEIIVNVLKLINHIGADPELFTVSGDSACVLSGFRMSSKYVTLECCPTAIDQIAEADDLEILRFQPKFPWNTHPTEGFLIEGMFTILEGGTPSPDRVNHEDFGVYTLKAKEVLDHAFKKGITIPYGNQLKKLYDTFPDTGSVDVEFTRMLLQFDRYYHYSDDIDVYRRGVVQEKKLCDMMKKNPRFALIADLLLVPETT